MELPWYSITKLSIRRSTIKIPVKINPHRILLIQLRQIGDVLLTSPLAKILKELYPKSYIAFLAEKPSYDVLSGNPCIDEVIVLDKIKGDFYSTIESIQKVRSKNFDLVIDTFGNPRSALITFLSGAKYRMGFDYRGRKPSQNANKLAPAPTSLSSALDNKRGNYHEVIKWYKISIKY